METSFKWGPKRKIHTTDTPWQSKLTATWYTLEQRVWSRTLQTESMVIYSPTESTVDGEGDGVIAG